MPGAVVGSMAENAEETGAVVGEIAEEEARFSP
jgi:hypothetical protein